MSSMASTSRPKSAMKRRMQQGPRSSYSDADSDVENQTNGNGLRRQNADSSPERRRSRTAAATVGRSVSVGDLLRKIRTAIITNIDDETLMREDTDALLIIITLLKEYMLGFIIAFVLVSLGLMIDNHFLLKLPTARNMRKATFAVMNDKETLSNFEENAGIKFIETDQYEATVNEIEQLPDEKKRLESILETKSKEISEMNEYLEEHDGEVRRMYETLGLDRFCADCMWSSGMKLTCIQRVEALGSKYNTPKYEAMISAMEKSSCWKTDGQMEEERKQRLPV